MGNVYIISGNDDFSRKKRARELAVQLGGEEFDDPGIEIITGESDNVKMDMCIIFNGQESIKSNIKVEVKEEKFKTFKLDGSSISNFELPKVDGYELIGFYDSKGNLVIDKYGNVYVYTNTKVIAKFELSEE